MTIAKRITTSGAGATVKLMSSPRAIRKMMIVPRREPARLDGGASAVDGDDRASDVASLRRGGEGDNARDLFDAGGSVEWDRRPLLEDPVMAYGLD